MKRRMVALTFAAWMAATPRLAAASYLEDAGIGVAAVFVNTIYSPTKIVYATLGGVTGTCALLLTGFNLEVAETVWTPSLGGDYVVAPAHLRGERILYFSGVVERPPPPGPTLVTPPGFD